MIILAILAAFILPAITAVSGAAQTTHERSAARGLVAGWRQWALEHDGRLLPGQLDLSVPLPPSEAPVSWNGTPIPEIARRRWLWRLVPYLADPEAMLWVNDQDAFHENAIANAPTSSDSLQAAAHSRMGPSSGPWRDSGGYLPHGSPRPAAARHAGNDCVSAAVFCWGLLATAPVTKHGHEHIDSYVTIVVGITAS